MIVSERKAELERRLLEPNRPVEQIRLELEYLNKLPADGRFDDDLYAMVAGMYSTVSQMTEAIGRRAVM